MNEKMKTESKKDKSMKPLETTTRPPKYVVKFYPGTYDEYGLYSYTHHNSLDEAKRSAKVNNGIILVRAISKLGEICLSDQYIPLADQ